MGNGHWPYEGWQHCAYMNNLRYQSSTGGAMSSYQRAAPRHRIRACYGVEGHMTTRAAWGSYFWWGGSGKNSQCP